MKPTQRPLSCSYHHFLVVWVGFLLFDQGPSLKGKSGVWESEFYILWKGRCFELFRSTTPCLCSHLGLFQPQLRKWGNTKHPLWILWLSFSLLESLIIPFIHMLTTASIIATLQHSTDHRHLLLPSILTLSIVTRTIVTRTTVGSPPNATRS